MKPLIAAVGLSTFVFAAAPAFGAEDEDVIVIRDKNAHVHRLKDIKSLDTDGDGKISRDEFLARSRDKFGKLDRDGDGFITEEERKQSFSMDFDAWEELEEERWEALLDRFDANDDAMLELDEIMAHVEERVARAMERMEEKRLRWEELDLPPMRMEFPRGPHALMLGGIAERLFETADADEDGEVTREEFAAARDKLFEKIDDDGDGVLSREEMRPLGFPGRFAFHYFHSGDEEDE